MTWEEGQSAPIDPEEYEAALALAWVTAQGGCSVLRLLRARSARALWEASLASLVDWGLEARAAARFVEGRRSFALAKALAALSNSKARFLPFASSAYPAQLKHLDQPPAGLFVVASPKTWERVLASPRLTIVGTRKVSTYGARVTSAFARAFAAGGITVVSGMALGVDSIAHRSALEAGGLTVAVLGSGTDVVYPPCNRHLYSQIAQCGAVVSEFPPGSKPTKWSFPRRNRILAAMADGVLVTEGSCQSGAMYTAEWAAALGRPILVVPGPVFFEQHSGCNRLLCEGAHPAVDPDRAREDFLFVSRIERGDREPVDLSAGWRAMTQVGVPASDVRGGPELGILQELGGEPCSVDDLVSNTGLSVRQVMAALVRLELEGKVLRAGPGLFIRAP